MWKISVINFELKPIVAIMENLEVENKLNEILKQNNDAEKAFSYVIQTIEHKGFQALMDKSISERIRFSKEITTMMKELKLKPKKGDDVINFRHRPWTYFKEIFSTNNDSAMLDEAIRGESHAIEFYETALKDLNLSEKHMAVLQNHLDSIFQTKTDLEILKRNVAATA